MRHIGEPFGNRLNSGQIVGLVQRGERRQTIELGQDLGPGVSPPLGEHTVCHRVRPAADNNHPPVAVHGSEPRCQYSHACPNLSTSHHIALTVLSPRKCPTKIAFVER